MTPNIIQYRWSVCSAAEKLFWPVSAKEISLKLGGRILTWAKKELLDQDKEADTGILSLTLRDTAIFFVVDIFTDFPGNKTWLLMETNQAYLVDWYTSVCNWVQLDGIWGDCCRSVDSTLYRVQLQFSMYWETKWSTWLKTPPLTTSYNRWPLDTGTLCSPYYILCLYVLWVNISKFFSPPRRLCFHPCLFVGLFVSRITQKQPSWFPPNLVAGWGLGLGRTHYIKGWIQERFSFLFNHVLWHINHFGYQISDIFHYRNKTIMCKSVLRCTECHSSVFLRM